MTDRMNDQTIVAQPITENLWWAIPGKLAGVRKPTALELDELNTAGVGAIVSVMDDPSNIDMYEQIGIPHLWLPTKMVALPQLKKKFSNYKPLLTNKITWAIG